ncbi:MAG: hypothetical protein JO020_09535, partial [Chloroflexi bacterium]|nr:hypothetical protein [Chloroflexota bacterium]
SSDRLVVPARSPNVTTLSACSRATAGDVAAAEQHLECSLQLATTTVKLRGEHGMVGRVDEAGADPRFRVAPLADARYRSRWYDRKR